MEWITQFIDIFLHIDRYLEVIVAEYGYWIYAILILVVFCETGLVVTPFLPGDSLLFAAGALAAIGAMNIWVLWGTLLIAAILGDAVNYQIGKHLGVKPFKLDAKIFKLKYLEKTEAFYERHGGKTIILARFIPIVRTFAPFVAGASQMCYRRFGFYNVTGALLWTTSMLGAGFFFGTMPVVKENFSLVVIGIVIISALPIGIEILKAMWARSRNKVARKDNKA
ncbi:DedA family protein [Ignatzschineria ureiclastica]|uniref:DedA family protein n=1 Tax=Ignatzschineria ureiclastica TaxID=472582 RepID=A0A2U2ACY6_9GAMM|nr:DedA family protein [Ignatzschineria ureiclastica]PWD80525.1 DedA family protein [Ignatzschineria ureiclastica]GGZ98799.1 membrane protein [Ignatzschineria ureiclastica]